MKVGVIVFPGSNCDADAQLGFSRVTGQEVTMLWHKDSSLEGCDLVVLPGGFSYGDYLRSGAIARFSPIMQAVQEHVDNGGNLVAICNGFQIACEMGLLPGALLHNDNQRFVCRTVTLKAEAGNALDLPTNQLFSI